MSALPPPRNPLIDTAIRLAHQWCTGHIIDGAPAIAHAMKVASKVDQRLPAASADLLAAVIVHHVTYFIPPGLDVDQVLADRLSPEVARIVRGLTREHDALDHGGSPSIRDEPPDVIIASAADKMVSIGAILRRAEQHPDPVAFWRQRRTFVRRVPYFHAFMNAAWMYLSIELAWDLGTVVAAAFGATLPAERPFPIAVQEGVIDAAQQPDHASR